MCAHINALFSAKVSPKTKVLLETLILAVGQMCKCPKSLSGSKREGNSLEVAQRMGGYNLVLFYLS